MSEEKKIIQYRAMGTRRRGLSVVGVYKDPESEFWKKHSKPRRLKKYDYEILAWNLSETKAFQQANVLNRMNGFPPHLTKKMKEKLAVKALKDLRQLGVQELPTLGST